MEAECPSSEAEHEWHELPWSARAAVKCDKCKIIQYTLWEYDEDIGHGEREL